MNTNMTGFRWFFQKSLHTCALDKSGLSVGKVKACLNPTLPLRPGSSKEIKCRDDLNGR